jgi:putative transposase
MPSIHPDREWELALAKYAVIAPLVCRELDPAQRETLRKEILAATHRFPGERYKPVAARTLRQWVRLYRLRGLDGLHAGTRKDKGVPRVVPPEVIERAKFLKSEEPDRSSRTICDLLASEGMGLVSPTTVGYHLRMDPPALEPDAGKPPKVFRRYEHRHPNDCWQSDMTDGLWMPDPADPTKMRKCYLHGFIDDHSRLITHAQFYWRESLPALENCFRRAITAYGLPAICYWDYVARHIIPIMCPIWLCGRRAKTLAKGRPSGSNRPHNYHNDSSQERSASSLRQTGFAGNPPSGDGGSQACRAASFARMLISA